MVTIDTKPEYRNTITSLSTLFQNESLMASYQFILSNGSNANGAYILYNNNRKKVSVMNGSNNINLGDGSITHANTYLSIIESGDKTNLIIDIDPKYLNTSTSISTLFYTHSTTHSLLSSYKNINKHITSSCINYLF